MRHPMSVSPLAAVVILALFALGSISSVHGQEPPAPNAEKDRERFELFTYCSPLDLVVEDLDDDDEPTTEQIERAVRSRLRAARIFSGDPATPDLYLYVNVNVVGRSFSTRVSLMKPVRDYWDYELAGTSETWHTGGAGTGDGNYILEILAQNIDEFIDEYLRVNTEHLAASMDVIEASIRDNGGDLDGFERLTCPRSQP